MTLERMGPHLKHPLVSVILPVYDLEEYLPRCLSSLRAQSYPHLEIWLVNDGSRDGSLALCQAAAQQDPRFHVIDQPNAGPSQARNAALAKATGKYLQFVDGDDYLPPDATETLVRTAEGTGADLTIAHFFRVSGDRSAQRGHIRGQRLLTRQEFALEMRKAPANFYYGVLWNKLYRRTIVRRNGLRLDPSLNWCEDFLFNLEYIKYVRLVAAVPKPVYYYVRREDSLVGSGITLRRTIQVKRTTFAYYKELYQAIDLYEEQKLGVYRYLLSAATDGSALSLPPFLEGRKPRRRPKP